jgi:hypothetical protein
MGRRSPVRVKEPLHRDLGRTSYALRDLDDDRQQGHTDGRLRTHQAGKDATK